MTMCPFLAILLATVRISLGREDAVDFGKATLEVEDTNFKENTSHRIRRIFPGKRCAHAEKVLPEFPTRKSFLSFWNPLKSQQHLQDGFLRNGTRNQSLKPEPLYHKALQGKDINIAIIRGSNAAGGNLEQDEKNIKGIFYNLFATWWNATMGNWTGSHAIVHNVAISSLGSYLFAFCYKTFLPVGVDVDLFVVE